MSETASERVSVAIVDYGMGNLYSVRRACEEAGMDGRITSSALDVASADAVILPGVGAFPDAMATLRRLDLVSVLHDVVSSRRPLIGICLGMQLLMSESEEFGTSRGLDIVPGTVEWIPAARGEGKRLKVPQVGWNTIWRPRAAGHGDAWSGTPLHGFDDDTFMYFVHSLVVRPEDSAVTLATTRYGTLEFCSALRKDKIFACQFHPERSGEIGMQMYRNMRSLVRNEEANSCR